MRPYLVMALVVLGSAAGWYGLRGRAAAAGRAPVMAMLQLPGGGEMAATMVGHEFREDDLPAIAAAPDGGMWVAWLSFVGDRDDVVIRHYRDGAWGNLQWVPDTSGDSWLPQVAVDAQNRVWVVWSQQVNGNWDLYARRFDPARQEWSALERLTSDPMPDINPRLTANGKGEFALAWQGFRAKNCNIFLKTFDGSQWSKEARVTNHAANDWDPAVALDSKGSAWVAYDSYRNGNYDVFLSELRGGMVQGEERAVAMTPRFEARATVAVDSADRVWVAWEAGSPNWGKDQGYMIRDRQPGVPLGAAREPQIRCLVGGRWREPGASLSAAFDGGNTYEPHVFSDGRGSIWVAALRRRPGGGGAGQGRKGKQKKQAAAGNARGYFEYWMTHLEGGAWSQAFALPHAKGRSSTRVNAALAKDGAFWIAWPTDSRAEGFYHRPLRQAVYAGRLPAAAQGAEPVLKDPVAENVEVKPGHADEAGDLKAIRSYVAMVGGKRLHIVRGDFHRHTELSWDGGGTNDGNLEDFYRYMIDAGGMDFGASTDHQGGAWPYWWWYTQKLTDMYHAPGAYVPIFGYERSVIYPNGHRNMFFARRAESRVTPFFLKEGAQGFGLPLSPQGDEPGVGTGEVVENDTKMLYEEIRGRNGLAISHTSSTRMGTDWRDNDPSLEPVVEIFQGCRASSEQEGAPFSADPVRNKDLNDRAGYHAEGMVSNAWAKGYKLGVTASSDHGSTHISYALVYTDNPTRQGILDAIRKRHTYGALDNIILDVHMGEHFMGDEFALARALPLRVKIRGTRAIAKVDVIKDSKVIYSTSPGKQTVEFEYTDKDSVAGRHYYYVRVQQDDQLLAWSSPMFINYR